MATLLWTPDPDKVARTNLHQFMAFANRAYGLHLTEYDGLYEWSVTDLEAFWEAVWKFIRIRASTSYGRVLENPEMPGCRWFPGARLNFAAHLLRYRDARTALIFVREGGRTAETITYAELYGRVARMTHFLRNAGVKAGDRVAGFLPNRMETVVAMLSATSLGAIWSSCSPDFGFAGVMDRFGQIAPKVLITADGYFYNGKAQSSLDTVARVLEATPSIASVVVIPFLQEQPDLSRLPSAILWEDALDNNGDAVSFVELPFEHPLYILYSSGTTGAPKCIVHGAGGTLIQHAKELILHTDLKREDVIFYFTTCGWMMWHWLVSSLFVGATVVLYDGSPLYPDLGVLWRMVQDLGITVFGTSAKQIDLCKKAGIEPGRDCDLSSLRAILSTGSPLSAENFEWVYRTVKADVQLASISGGTDIISCFMLGDPTSPVYAGEIQKRGLGMKVEAWSEAGESLIGKKGELVCTRPFPSMPVGFWDDRDDEKYREAYFSQFEGVWWHGDYIEVTPRGGVIVYGRSDATLNPGGVRIGTAEIYRQVETVPEVADSLVVGQVWEGDTRIVLFVVLRDGILLSDALVRKINERIRSHTTPRHVPAKVLQVPEIPYTINGKKVELAVRHLIHGERVTNRDALANPQALDYYANLPQLNE